MLTEQEKEIAALVDAGRGFDETEALVAAYSPQLRAGGRCVIYIPLKSMQALLRWVPSEAQWVSVTEGSETLLGVLIPADPDRPAARFYFALVDRGGLEVLQPHLPHYAEAVGFASLEAMADSAGFEGRVRAYAQANGSPQVELLEALLKGRAGATAASEAHILDTGGRCLVCGEAAAPGFVTTTVGTAAGASSLSFALCAAHEGEAASMFLFDFLAGKFGVELPLQIAEMASEDVYLQIEASLRALACRDLKRDDTKIQVTGLRESGLRVILRCEGHTGKRSYAYMVTTPDKVNLRRVDNARDHPEQQFRWDHVHLGLPAENRTVGPSFTFGLASLDLPTLRAEIERAEAVWLARQG